MKRIDNYPLKIINDLPPITASKDKVAMDIEMFGMKKGHLHRPTGEFAFLGATFDGETVYYVDSEKEIQEFLNRVENSTWIFHKGDFDIRQLRRWANIPNRSKYYDTMYMEKILFSGYYDSFSLKALVRRWLGAYMEKEVRDDFEKAKELTEETLRYACLDVIATWHVYQEQRKHCKRNDLDLWKNIDQKTLWCILNMNGMKLDVEAWTALAEKHEARVDELQNKYPDMNIGSGKQVAEKLIADGYDLPKTEKGNYRTAKGVLEKLDANEFVEDKLEYATVKKLAGTYGKNIIKNYLEPDGRIWSNFNLDGAATGRFCVSADTMLETSLGHFPICDLPLTSESACTIITHTGKEKEITNKIFKGIEELFEVELDNGNKIKCTKNHVFLTDKGWKSLKDINIDEDWILTP